MEHDSSSPPPVPPKDIQYQADSSSMDATHPPSAPASASKRRRDAQDDIDYHYAFDNDRLEVGRSDRPTPSKRSRSRPAASDGDMSDTPSQNAAQLRRKKGSRNLSNLNLRHAASTSILPRREHSPPRESRFQEGSLNDKPSQLPPSVFTRVIHNDSGSLSYVDDLMADYHEGLPTPARHVQATIEQEKDMIPARVAEINARNNKEDAGGLFRFGKSWSSNFRPVALWNRLWNDTKDELTRQNMLEAGRKARLKAEAEAKYAEMKSAGQFGETHAGLATPRDSAVVMDRDFKEHRRTESLESHEHARDEQSKEGGPMLEPPRTLRGRLSRVHLRKPSLASLTGTIKRAKSDFNLAAAHAPQREPSASMSPRKGEFDGPSMVLKSSASKYDLKKQHRLSKRVSNLEEKLQRARMELDTALAEASPAPKFSGKFERFTPVNSLKGSTRRPKFVPGALQTLPSERLLFPELRGPETYEETVPCSECEGQTSREPEQSTLFDEECARSPRGQSLRRHVKDVFQSAADEENGISRLSNEGNRESVTTEPPRKQSAHEGVEANSAAYGTANGVADLTKEPHSAILDAKLKALNASVKAAQKPAKSKKRRSLADQDFKTGEAADLDDAEWEEAAHTAAKKKRKSAGKADVSSPPKTRSPADRATKKNVSTVETRKLESADWQVLEMAKQTSLAFEVDEGDNVFGSEDELARPKTADGDEPLLEPVHEEEEETSIVPLQDEPSNATATATPTRYGRHAVRSRSNSPHKRTTRAMSRQSRSASPPCRAVNDAKKAMPGHDGGSSRAQSGSKDESFEWPDDVF